MSHVAAILVFLSIAAGWSTGLHAWPTVKLPPGSEGEMVSEHMSYNGLDMRTSRFTSPLPPEEVAEFYAAQWPGQHVTNSAAGKTIIGHMEGEHFVTIELEASGDGSEATIGIVKAPATGAEPELGKGFYRPAGTQVVSDITHLDTPTRTRTLVLQNELSPYVNQQHYQQRMRAEGWRMVGTETCRPSARECVARFEGDSGKKMMMTMTRDQTQLTSTVVTIE